MKATQAIKPYRTFKGHTGSISSVIHLTGRQRMMTCSTDGSLREWNLETGEQIGNDWRDGERGVYAAVLSPDGKKIVSGGKDGIVKLWDIDTSKIIAKWTGHGDGIGGGIASVCWNRDGRRILSGSFNGTAMVWDVESGNTILAIKTGHSVLHSAIYSLDETMIASGGRIEDGFIKIWDANTGKLMAKLEGRTFAVYCLAWTADGKTLLSGTAGKTLISGSIDFSIITWDTTTWQQINVFTGHTGLVRGIALSPNGLIFASASGDKTVRLWNLENGQPIGMPLQHPAVVACVSFSTDGKLLVTGCNDSNAYSWDIAAIGREAGLDELLLSPNDGDKSLLKADAKRHPRQRRDVHRIPERFFDDSPRARHPCPSESCETTFSTSQRHAQRPTLLGHVSLLFRRTHHTTNDTTPRPHILERALSLLSGTTHRRNDEGIEFQEHGQCVVDVPLAQGHFRNYSARELLMKRKKEKEKAAAAKKASAGSSRPPQGAVQHSGGAAQARPSSNMHATVPTSSTTPAIVNTSAATTSATSPPDVMIPRAGRWTRFMLFICCVPTQTIDGHH